MKIHTTTKIVELLCPGIFKQVRLNQKDIPNELISIHRNRLLSASTSRNFEDLNIKMTVHSIYNGANTDEG